MKIFGFGTSSGKDLQITEDDRLWVDENFKWLKDVFAYPDPAQEQMLLTAKWFPATFATQPVTIENVVTDLCKLFNIPRETVKFETITDIRDTVGVPYEISPEALQCDTELIKGNYKIFVANSLTRDPERLMYHLLYQFVRIRVNYNELEFADDTEDTGPFTYLYGIYCGAGVILAQNLIHAGRSSDGMWEEKWNYVSEMAQPVMAYALATYAYMRGENDPVWKNELKGDFRKMLEDSIAWLRANPNGLFDENEIKANGLFRETHEYYCNQDWDGAIAALQKVLFLTSDKMMKCEAHNGIGYYYLRKGDYQQAISNFRKALSFEPWYAYASDNLGYALTLTGDLDEVVPHLEHAMRTANNDPAYTYRNFALYHYRRKEFDLAEEYFQKSFDRATPVDFLEYHYGEFLMERGDIERATEFFQKSAAKKEAEGSMKLRELGHQ